jgi:hypothetical protein
MVGTHAERLHGETGTHDLGRHQANSYDNSLSQKLTGGSHQDYVNPFL